VETLRQQIAKLKASESERKLAERDLQEREERLRVIFETVSDAIVTLDLQHTITHANRATELILGYSREELVGSPIDHFATPGSAALGYEKTEKALRGEPLPPIFELEGLRKDGTRVLLEAKARFLREEGKPVGIVCIFSGCHRAKAA
jgi:PAS domain S-box-containing protein